LKIIIDVSVEPGQDGGTAPALRSLISTLGSLTDGTEEYAIVVGSERQIEWLGPLSANQKFVLRQSKGRNLRRRVLSPIAWHLRSFLLPRAWPEVPISDGFYESLGCDAIHFPTQGFKICAIPSVYNPHDLQHLHYPQFFTPAEVVRRETIYSAGCHFAQTVIVNSQWVKDDVTAQYGISPGKLQIIPEAPPTQLTPAPSEDDLRRVKERYRLTEEFALYPSVNWPHKNHLRLMEAVAYLRDQGLVVPLVCTGARHEASWPRIETRLSELSLTNQVRFLGFVPQEHLRSLYRLARCLVLPTLFEANSLPIFEAWLEDVPVACSNVTALPEQVMDAALIFDPFDCRSISDVIARLFKDARLREELRAKGRRRLAHFDWTRTAREYRAVYRRTAGQRLSEEDQYLLEWDWMRNPRRIARVEA
jgi:glycosyltransferase involved in cell wall biosynthesis